MEQDRKLEDDLFDAALVQSWISHLAEAIKKQNWNDVRDVANRLYAHRDNLLDKVKSEDPGIN